MVRPRKRRRLCEYPGVLGFRPIGDSGESVELRFDEYEACRLIDTLHFTQEECARQMNVARSTVAAIYQSARAKIADALFYGKTLNFHGGDVELCKFHSECCGRCGQRDCAACGKCGKGKRLQ
ncbi:MAG: DUF134 domain-containing protein [Thermoguttaceae bacterium]|jgi:predicted DNA-binding protein (UPF0251 family)|nr:DUF134 domain-containing protein [Thermoguttaceae bacterium]MBQ1863182.1 DUF134 domain-containing protein [Thermoguttaceae bacterium]MBQ2038529.1 DUF134 domain-containing protein [Thermoguttaceae bacterium]MBQ3822521.1 DUF134 domain-containing protein [Thermoguttaceae bacterium]MBQ4079417.1 DUF134 domain-containing protein [Thermoguttaceae bacterium]